MKAINRALKDQSLNNAWRLIETISNNEMPCIFISYQREDEKYAKEISEYIESKQLDVYFDLDDKDLKLNKQTNDPKGVTMSIQKGLNEASHMIILISPNTYKSPWVPFEVGYVYDKMGNNMKLLRHKDIDKSTLPSYLMTKEILNGTKSLESFLKTIRTRYSIYENRIQKGEEIKAFSEYYSNPLSSYLSNE